MKYMGSKRNMLQNGLGKTLSEEIKGKARFVDLFAGSAAVSWFIGERFDTPVLAVDLQSYSSILANSVLLRTTIDSCIEIKYDKIIKNVREQLRKDPSYLFSKKLESNLNFSIPVLAKQSRNICSQEPGGAIWTSYGGYYFSPSQARIFDAFNSVIPNNEPYKSFFKALVIMAGSRCAASPGHTAQPFKPNETAGKYLLDAWRRDVFQCIEKDFNLLKSIIAKKKGAGITSNAMDIVYRLKEDDIVFIDPPYSGVHYSRFYHVLETIAVGYCGPVEGEGRYPAPSERPVSNYSKKGESEKEFRALINLLHERGCKIIVTYPEGDCSNGLSGKTVLEIISQKFSIKQNIVDSHFSTLGGNREIRAARKTVKELILVSTPI
jgi:adenine-specific DNA-methyltransferase